MTHYSKGLAIRNADGKALPDGASIGAYGELFIDDGTGFVSGTDPTNEVVDATPVKVSRLLHVTAVAAERSASTDGRLTVQVPGDYFVYAQGMVSLTGAADTGTVRVARNGAAVADAAATPGGDIKFSMVAGDANPVPFTLFGILPDMNVGDYVQLFVTGTGSTALTIKSMRFGIRQIGDMARPGEPTT